MERYICIHAHFYQPPRENPWLEEIELQDSAYPYHDWNERVSAECYEPNATSRILDEKERIAKIVNNYSQISFNIGPTLMAWFERHAPALYHAILEADKGSRRRFSGHSSAMAQVYNHMILPLANQRDKYTQVIWAIRDFEHRFGLKPEGMWLPETAVNLETLEVLAELDIKFTLLAPHQAMRVKPMIGGEWEDVSGGRIDPSQAYLQRLPSGRSISVFFYDGPISHSVAFEGLLHKGEGFAHRLMNAFSEDRDWPQLVNIATDGETYGHHHRHGEMALTYALYHIESRNIAHNTNYGEYLEKHPPSWEVEIIENTSWSCAHGVERWRSNCGCNTGGHAGWQQEWRVALREAMDWFRDTIAPKYEKRASALLKDPWRARNDYIDLVLDRSQRSLESFLKRHARSALNEKETTTVLKLLELQRHAMLMYTSCGWFFDELSGIETVQVIQFAGRAIQLAEELFGESFEHHFLELLARAKSNIPEHANGQSIYDKFVKPARVNLAKVAAHYAITSLFEEYPDHAFVYSYSVDRERWQIFEAGRARLLVGRARFISVITREQATMSFAVLDAGSHNVIGGSREFKGEGAYNKMVEELSKAFNRAAYLEVARLVDRHFDGSLYSLRSLFKDQQRKIMARILENVLTEVEAYYRNAYKNHQPLMRFLTDLGYPLPKVLYSAAEFTINSELRKNLTEREFDLQQMQSILEEANRWKVPLDDEGLGLLFRRALETMMERFRSDMQNLALLKKLVEAVTLIRSLPFEVDLWRVQNLYYDVLNEAYLDFHTKTAKTDKPMKEWITNFSALGDRLGIAGS